MLDDLLALLDGTEGSNPGLRRKSRDSLGPGDDSDALTPIADDRHRRPSHKRDGGKRFEEVQRILAAFNSDNAQTFTFPELRGSEGRRERLFGFLFEILRQGKVAETEILADETEMYMDDVQERTSLASILFGHHRPRDNIDIDREKEGRYQDPELFAHLTLLKLTCLETIRILSRDKVLYHPHFVTEENMVTLIRLIKTDPFDAIITPDCNDDDEDGKIGGGERSADGGTDEASPNLSAEERLQILEAQKCLCNFIFNDTEARTIVASSLCPQIIMGREPWFWKDRALRELVFFDARILFLLTALVPELRRRLAGFGDDAFKDVTLTKLAIVIPYFAFSHPDPETGQCVRADLDVINELLKVAFNVTMHLRQSGDRVPTAEQPGQVLALVVVCRELLFAAADSTFCGAGDRAELVSHVINLLTNIPASDYWSLVPPIVAPGDQEDGDDGADKLARKRKMATPGTERFREKLIKVDAKDDTSPAAAPNGSKHGQAPTEGVEEYDMTAISAVLDFLTTRLVALDGGGRVSNEQVKSGDSAGANSTYEVSRLARETLVPCLLFLTEACKAVRPIRKWLKPRILPPLTALDVQSLPEQGTTLRNRLCKLLTSPSTDVKGLAADFLFTLCKENVARMIKYTGYGNAAGLFARLGLLKGGQGPNQDAYSSGSSSEDETKRGEAGAEYERVLPDINPVTGRWEPRDNDAGDGGHFGGAGPGSSMTEEEKEAEALEFVRLMERLRQNGVIQPMKVGKDGKPVPFDSGSILRQAEAEAEEEQLRRGTDEHHQPGESHATAGGRYGIFDKPD